MSTSRTLTISAASLVVLAGGLVAGEATTAQAAPGPSPLPVSERVIAQYHLSNRQIQEIKKAQKLAATPKAKQIRWRESNNHYHLNDGDGYYGAWQFDRGTWLSNGGGKFAKTANKAPKWAQDYIMWKTHEARGWQPWGG